TVFLREGIAFHAENDRSRNAILPVTAVGGDQMEAIRSRIARYSDFLEPLRSAVERYLKYPSKITPDGVMLIGHMPWIGPQAYMFRLYPGIDDESLERYKRTLEIDIPQSYAHFLREVNGAFCFGISFCGVPLSMLGSPPLLDRSTQQCHDLSTAVKEWIRRYRVPPTLFHFGYMESETENLGHFIDEAGRI